MKFIELNSENFTETQKLQLDDYLQTQPAADRLILDCRSVSDNELKRLVDTVRTRYIVYAFASEPQAELLSKYGHFELTKIWDSADFIHQLEFMFDDHDYAQGFTGPDEGTKFSKDLTTKADYVERRGRYEIELAGDFSENEETLAFSYGNGRGWTGGTWPFRHIYKSGKYLLTLEVETTGTLKMIQRISSLDKSGKLLKQDDLHSGDNIFERTKETANLFVQVFLSGKGSLKLGKTWIYKYKYDLGYFALGDRRDYTKAGEPVYSFYIPGKLPRKLLVGFSGALSEVPHYERQTMALAGFPTLLFMDMRARGGSMMLGKKMDPDYEALVEKIIDEKLHELKLTRQDLIFVGWSMGSYPALYYGIKMEAGDIIPCKPVVHLGDVTSNTSLTYRGDATFLTARSHLTGRAEKEDDDRLNAVLPNLIEKQNLERTKIHAFIMKNDELDNSRDFLESLRPKLCQLEVETQKGFHVEGMPQMSQFITKIMEKIKAEVED
ncbi:accessory Sec system protein Asp2 [Lactovum odontotermitis]